MVWEWREREREDCEVGRAVNRVSEDRASTFAAGDENKVVACREWEDAEDAVDGPRRRCLGGPSVGGYIPVSQVQHTSCELTLENDLARAAVKGQCTRIGSARNRFEPILGRRLVSIQC